MPKLRRIDPNLSTALVALVLLLLGAIWSSVPADGATSSSAVGATVLSASYLDASGCGGAALTLGTLVQGSTSITPSDCQVVFGSSNDTARLRAMQADGRGAALGRFQPTPTIFQGAPQYWGATSDGANKAWLVGIPGRSSDPTPIVATTDGGTTWTTQTPCAGSLNLLDAAYVSASTVVAVGTSNVVCRTTDGGTTWNRITPNPAGQWYGVDMLPSGEGWMVGLSGLVQHTVDGGATWSALPNPDPTFSFRDVSIGSTSNIYAIGWDTAVPPNVRAMASTDGGSTWTSTTLGNTFIGGWGYTVDALDATHAIVGSSYGKFRTSNSGATWPLVDATPALCEVSFSATTAIAYYGAGVAPRRTTDGGTTWSNATMTTPSTGQINACTADSATVAYAGGFNDQRIVSTDAGATSTTVATTFRDQYAISPWSGMRFVSVGDSGTVRRTTDGGTTITPVTSGTTQPLRDVEAFGAATAIAVGDAGTILRSTDTAATWASVTSGTAQSLLAVDRAPDGSLFAVGGSGVVLRSLDDGVTWTARVAPTAQQLNDVWAGSASDVWVVGNNGEMYRSANGGTTWTAQASGTTLNLLSIDSIDGTTALATTTVNGSLLAGILRTSDGGTSWTLTMGIGPGSSYAYRVRWLNATTAVVATSGGYRRSTDGGLTWTLYSTSFGNPWAIAALDGNSLLIAGQSDVIARTAPTTEVPDYVSGSTDFSSAGGAFGACLQTATNLTTTGWPIAGAGACTSANGTAWRALAQDAAGATATLASTGTSVTNGTVNLRFAARPGTHAPGLYTADVRFEVVAPDA